jgi:hypothetical protein
MPAVAAVQKPRAADPRARVRRARTRKIDANRESSTMTLAMREK